MFRAGFAVALVGCLSLAAVGTAQPPVVTPSVGSSQPPVVTPSVGGDQPVVKSTPTRVTPAASVRFRKDLNLPFPSLNTLGGRIDSARRAGDPVALANAASELYGAEKVSGRSSSLTSQQILREAAELATLRRQEAELKAVLHVSDQVTLEQEKVAELKRLIELNKAEKRGIEQYEEPKNAPRKVVVNNYTTQYIDVQLNGYLRGQVSPGSTRVIMIEQRWNPVVLKGWGDADETTYGPVVLQGRFNTYTWNINGDDAIPNIP